MELLQLNLISEDGIKSVTSSFENLPHTNHRDGKYRLRRFASVELRTTFWNCKEEVEVTSLNQTEFTQSSEFNSHQGGMTREFEEVTEDTLQSAGLKEMLLNFKNANDLSDGHHVDIHQMRVIPCEEDFGDATPLSPEGVHQDGFRHIAMVGVARHNINGGELLVYNTQTSDPFLIYKLKAGEILMLDDSRLWHNATPISRIKNGPAYGDWFVFCAKKD